MPNPNVDLEAVINDSITDSQLPAEVDVDTPEVEEVVEETPVEEPVAEEPVAEEAPADEPAQAAVESPAAATKDDFERIAGMPAIGPMGRENRIPYSRVKKITEKAVTELAETVVGRKLNPGERAADVVKSFVAEVPQLRTKVTDYEARLTKVGEFEDIIQNKPKQFIQMLEQLPQYKGFFDFVRASVAGKTPGAPASDAAATQATQAAMASDAMPEPDQELPDGTKVYSLDGLKQLLLWNSKDTEQRVLRQVESNYAPIRQEWQARQHYEAVIPQIRAKIAEAKQWPLFDENEAEITAALEADESLTLEGAYRQVVFPKLVAERTTMRQQVLQEARQAPRATSVPVKPVTQKAQPTEGPRKLEDIIRESIATLK